MGLFDKIKTSSNESVRIMDWTPQWDTGAPCVQIISSEYKTYLTYIINDNDDSASESLTSFPDDNPDQASPMALIEFSALAFRFGGANDEVQHGLPLWDKGLEYYSAHIIENSLWIEEIKSVNRVHDRYNEKMWTDYKHFVLLFKDENLEIIARDYKVELFRSTPRRLATEVINRLYKSTTA